MRAATKGGSYTLGGGRGGTIRLLGETKDTTTFCQRPQVDLPCLVLTLLTLTILLVLHFASLLLVLLVLRGLLGLQWFCLLLVWCLPSATKLLAPIAVQEAEHPPEKLLGSMQDTLGLTAPI